MSSALDRIRGNQLLLIAAVVAVTIATSGAGAGAATGAGGGTGGAGAAGGVFRVQTSITNPAFAAPFEHSIVSGTIYRGSFLQGPVLSSGTPAAGVFSGGQLAGVVNISGIPASVYGQALVGAAPGFVPGLGVTGATGSAFAAGATGAGLSGAALRRTALTGALFALSSLGGQEGGESATPTTTINSENTPTQWAIGQVRKAGLLAYLSYDENSLYQALVLSEGECEGIDRIFVRTRGEFEFIRARIEQQVVATATGDDGITREFMGDVVVEDPASNRLLPVETSPFRYTEEVQLGTVPDQNAQDNRRRVTYERPLFAMEVYEYFDADGSQGQEMIDEVRGSRTGLRWDRSHQLNGKSWVFVKSTQPPYSLTSRDEFINRFWQQAPDTTFQMKGIKITWPGQPTPRWTENTAAIYYWWLTQRRGFHPSVVNVDAFNAAFAKCNELLTLEGLENFREDYPRTTARYTCGGTISSTGGVTQVQSQLNLAMAGELQHNGGQIYIKPGADELPVATITSDLLISEPEITIYPDSSAAYNSVSATLQQNYLDSFGQHTIPDLDDEEVIRFEDDPGGLRPGSGLNGQETRQEYIDRGGSYIGTETKKTRTIGFSLINNPVSAVNNMIITLRQRRASLSVSFSIMAGNNLELFNLVPGQKVLLDVPESGLESNKPFRIAGTTFNPNGSINMTLNEWPDDLYDDTIILPALPERQLPEETTIPAPTGLTGVITPQITTTGQARYQLRITWDNANINTALYVNRIGGDFDPIWDVRRDGEFITYVNEPGEYVIEARHIDIYGTSSSISSTSATLLESSIPVPTPRLESSEVRNGYLRGVFTGTGNRNIADVDVRASFQSGSGTQPTLDVLTETTWSTGRKIPSNVILPTDPNDDIEVFSNFQENGWYRVFIRYVDKFNSLSSIVDLGYHLVSIPAVPSVSYHSHPQWEGILNNFYKWKHDSMDYILPDQPMARTMTNDEWRGVDDKPFNDSPEGYYETISRDLGKVKEVNISVSSIADTIDNRMPLSPIEYKIYTRSGEEMPWVEFDFTPGTPVQSMTRFVKARITTNETGNNTRIRDVILTIEDA